MTMKRTSAVLAVLVLSGCARPGESAGSPAPLPTLTRPTAPPNGPSDQIKNTGWTVGTVTTGGSGPCYGLTTDDGVVYALHNADGIKLTRGTMVRVKTKAALVRIYCGPGKLVEMTAMEPIG